MSSSRQAAALARRGRGPSSLPARSPPGTAGGGPGAALPLRAGAADAPGCIAQACKEINKDIIVTL